jgi:hypothetical protein
MSAASLSPSTKSPGSGRARLGITDPLVAPAGMVATFPKMVWEMATFIQVSPLQSVAHASRKLS